MVEQLAKEMGGKLEAFYYAFGSDDFVIILDLPSMPPPSSPRRAAW
jgi:uncharacterized protein with GYD domain